MVRVHIELPDKFTFTTEIEIRMADVNMAGHVGSDRFHTILNEAQLKFLEAKGFFDLAMGNVAMLNVDFAITYKAESFYQDILIIEAGASDFHKKGCDITYRAIAKKNGKEVAIAKTGLLLFDYKTRKTVSMTDEIKAVLSEAVSN